MVKHFDKIYNQYFKDVYKYIFALSQSKETAEEITQETFFKALKGIDSFRGDCDLRVWLCQIAKHTYFRELKKDKHVAGELDLEQPDRTDTEADFIKKESALQIYQILHHMEEPYKEVFSVRTFGELPFKEIGQIFGKSEGWARVIYYRAKVKIQERLEEEQHE
ncbi:MAG: RNA polymerase sigma factor [Clostridiales Family XIII bacterium]|nr:RNA polymerase sigma factor [Clostridiales Family XIII bacterium]